MKFGNDISQALCVSTIESPNRIEVLYRKTVKMGFRRIRSKNKTKKNDHTEEDKEYANKYTKYYLEF